ncbi:hypothetical protein KI387_025575, partial [Taxus chinensis]
HKGNERTFPSVPRWDDMPDEIYPSSSSVIHGFGGMVEQGNNYISSTEDQHDQS